MPSIVRSNRPIGAQAILFAAAILVVPSPLVSLAVAEGQTTGGDHPPAPSEPVPAQTSPTCARDVVTARGEPSSFEWIAKTKARANWRHRVRLMPELGPDYSDWKAAADIDESCLVGPEGTVCSLTARPCRKT